MEANVVVATDERLNVRRTPAFTGAAVNQLTISNQRCRRLPCNAIVRGCMMSVRSEWRVHNGLTREEEVEWAKDWCLKHDLPFVGFVIIKDGLPCEWQQNKPKVHKLKPGTIALGIDGGGRFMVTQTFYGHKWAEVK